MRVIRYRSSASFETAPALVRVGPAATIAITRRRLHCVPEPSGRARGRAEIGGEVAGELAALESRVAYIGLPVLCESSRGGEKTSEHFHLSSSIMYSVASLEWTRASFL